MSYQLVVSTMPDLGATPLKPGTHQKHSCPRDTSVKMYGELRAPGIGGNKNHRNAQLVNSYHRQKLKISYFWGASYLQVVRSCELCLRQW